MAIHALDQRIAGLSVVAGRGELFQRGAIVALEFRMLGCECNGETAGVRIREFARQALGQQGDFPPFGIERTHVFGALCFVMPTDQDVLPLLHLHAEFATQSLAVGRLCDLHRHLGGQAEPGRAQAGKRAEQNDGQAQGQGAQQLGLQAEGTGNKGRRHGSAVRERKALP